MNTLIQDEESIILDLVQFLKTNFFIALNHKEIERVQVVKNLLPKKIKSHSIKSYQF